MKHTEDIQVLSTTKFDKARIVDLAKECGSLNIARTPISIRVDNTRYDNVDEFVEHYYEQSYKKWAIYQNDLGSIYWHIMALEHPKDHLSISVEAQTPVQAQTILKKITITLEAFEKGKVSDKKGMSSESAPISVTVTTSDSERQYQQSKETKTFKRWFIDNKYEIIKSILLILITSLISLLINKLAN